jgi:very-short-patch-repair endonuclease
MSMSPSRQALSAPGAKPLESIVDSPPVVRAIAELAAPHAGCVSRCELLGRGVGRGQIASLLAREVLRTVVPGIYLLAGRQLDQEALWWAALLRAGPGARLGHRSALERWRVLPPAPSEAVVIVPRRIRAERRIRTEIATECGRLATVVVLSAPSQPAASCVRGIPADGVLQAIDDLAVAGRERDVRRAWREADYLGLLNPDHVVRHLHRNSRGQGMIRTLLREVPIVGHDADLRSRLERHLLEALVRANVAAPAVNALVDFGGRMLRPDLWWAWAQLVVELDGPAHRQPARQAADAERDGYLASLGVEVLRFSDEEIRDALDACVTAIVARLAARAAWLGGAVPGMHREASL